MPATSNTSSISTIYAFGDSLSDAGNVSLITALIGEEPVSPPYNSQSYGLVSASEFSNGPVWVQDLAAILGLGRLTPSLTGGTDFAYGGAEAGNEPQNAGNITTQALSLPAQLLQFSLTVEHAAASALFTISVGGNDIFDILSNGALTATQQAADVTAAVNNELSAIATMYGDGMRNIAVLNVPDLGVVPNVTDGLVNGSNTPSTTLDALAGNLSASYDAQLASGLASLTATDPFSYHIVDTYSLIENAYNNPSAYGYTNVTTPVWSGSFTSASSGTLSSANVSIQNQSLFFDHFHPTETGHADIANIAAAQVAPSYVLEADITAGTDTIDLANAYLGPDTSLHTEFATVTPDTVALFATTPGTFLQTGTGDNILVAQSGDNVLATSGGSSFLEAGTGSDTFYIDASATTTTWNSINNFHAGDILSIVGYRPGVSAVLWTTDPGVDGAVLNVNIAGSGTVWSSDTFIGVSLATARNYGSTVASANGTGIYTVYT
jgi:phospholipase/lecithinase/hemolysin